MGLKYVSVAVEKYCLNPLQQDPSTLNPIPLAVTLLIEDGHQVEIRADDLHELVCQKAKAKLVLGDRTSSLPGFDVCSFSTLTAGSLWGELHSCCNERRSEMWKDWNRQQEFNQERVVITRMANNGALLPGSVTLAVSLLCVSLKFLFLPPYLHHSAVLQWKPPSTQAALFFFNTGAFVPLACPQCILNMHTRSHSHPCGTCCVSLIPPH